MQQLRKPGVASYTAAQLCMQIHLTCMFCPSLLAVCTSSRRHKPGSVTSMRQGSAGPLRATGCSRTLGECHSGVPQICSTDCFQAGTLAAFINNFMTLGPHSCIALHVCADCLEAHDALAAMCRRCCCTVAAAARNCVRHRSPQACQTCFCAQLAPAAARQPHFPSSSWQRSCLA